MTASSEAFNKSFGRKRSIIELFDDDDDGDDDCVLAFAADHIDPEAAGAAAAAADAAPPRWAAEAVLADAAAAWLPRWQLRLRNAVDIWGPGYGRLEGLRRGATWRIRKRIKKFRVPGRNIGHRWHQFKYDVDPWVNEEGLEWVFFLAVQNGDMHPDIGVAYAGPIMRIPGND
jgi:hypothetical protein